MAVAKEYGDQMDRCGAYVPVAERLRLAGRPAFAQRLQFVLADVAEARRIVYNMAQSERATQIELLRIASDGQRDVFAIQQQTHDRQQLGYALYNRAFTDMQQGLQRLPCPRCRGMPTVTLCPTCLGAGTITASIR